MTQNGFSLIELIVVISIIGILTGISVNVYRNAVNERKMHVDVGLVTGIIEEIKQKARARDISPNGNCTNFQSYDLVVNPTSNTLSQQFVCDGNTISVADYPLENTTIEQPASITRLSFIAPMGQHTSSALTIVLKNRSTKMCISIQIPQVQTVIVSDPYSC